MPNEISDKIYVIVQEAKKVKHNNAILFAEAISKRKLEEFSYVRNNRTQYCDLKTVKEYVSFAKKIAALSEELSASKSPTFRSKIGFDTWVGDILLEFLDSKKTSITVLKEHAQKLIDLNTLSTTEKIYQSINPDISVKHFKWSLSLLQDVKPGIMGVCKKWVWNPNKILIY